MLMFVRMTMTAVAICESLMVIGNGRIGKIPKTGKTGHKIGEIYKMEGDIRVRGTVRGGEQILGQRIIFRDTAHNLHWKLKKRVCDDCWHKYMAAGFIGTDWANTVIIILASQTFRFILNPVFWLHWFPHLWNWLNYPQVITDARHSILRVLFESVCLWPSISRSIWPRHLSHIWLRHNIPICHKVAPTTPKVNFPPSSALFLVHDYLALPWLSLDS